jgi:hypothetical protein
MVKARGYKREGREPDAGDLAGVLPAHKRKVRGQTDQPVGSDAAQENLVPGGRDGFRGREGDDSSVLDRLAKSASVPEDDGHDEERTSKVSPECNEPVQQHFPGRETAVQSGDCRELFIEHNIVSAPLVIFPRIASMETHHETPRTQVRSRGQNRHESPGEYYC